MKKTVLILLAFGAIVLLFSCSENSLLPDQIDPVKSELENSFKKSAKKPAANLLGITNCPFSFTPPAFWNGTVDFGDYGVFGLTFISHDAPRDYSQASPYLEDFIIYNLGTDWSDPANVVMKGWNRGVVTYANKLPDPVQFHAEGKITEAYGPLEAWNGCNWQVKGLVYYDMDIGLPEKAIGEVRIN